MAYNNAGVVDAMRVSDAVTVQCVADGELRSFSLRSGDYTIPLFNVHYTSMNDDDIGLKLHEIVSALNR